MTSLVDPKEIINNLENILCPTVIIESKIDYGRMLWRDNDFYSLQLENKPFGSIKISPKKIKPTITIVSYGETARHISDNLDLFFEETDEIAELICLTKLHPIDLSLTIDSVKYTKKFNNC